VAPGGLERAAAFRYEVVYESGAFVRDGKELSARHVHTFSCHSIIEVGERCINEQGLARLQVRAPGRDRPLGWISERLNPMSGQRGPICRPLSMVCPLIYRVVFASGAVVRADVELISRKVGVLPYNRVISVSEKCFTHHPAQRCVPRLRLADGSGWISLRTNDPPSQAREIVRLMGAEEAEALRRRSYGLEDLRAHWEEAKMGEDERGGGGARMGGGMLWEEPSDGHSKALEEQTKRFARAMKHIGDADWDAALTDAADDDDDGDVTCLICFDQPRNATIVHGTSGHVCSCLDCARLLCARGDFCPVCRKPIDNVIENFWAPKMVPNPGLLEPPAFSRRAPRALAGGGPGGDGGVVDLADAKLEAEAAALHALEEAWRAEDVEAMDAAPWHVISTEGADLYEELRGADAQLTAASGGDGGGAGLPVLDFERPVTRLPFGTLVLAIRRRPDDEVLRILQPVKGHAYIRSLGGKFLFRPGGLEEGARWHFEVIYQTGAYVREGVELTSRHTHTFAVTEIIEVRGRCFNSQNLARLQVVDPQAELRGGRGSLGWISEVLNPISAQHGSIVSQVPMVCPLQYRVTYPDGAVVRAGIELESRKVGHLPVGTVVTVVEKVFSQHPSKRCVPRLKLADGGGWISQRLNAILESDGHEIVELIGAHPGEALQRMQPGLKGNIPTKLPKIAVSNSVAISLAPPGSTPQTKQGKGVGGGAKNKTLDLARRLDERAFFSDGGGSGDWGEAKTGGVLDGEAERSGDAEAKEGGPCELCACCGKAPRTATLIHEEFGKETGHVVVCIDCGNKLKLHHRGCPVCGMPIENVIQHFWA